MGQLQVTRALEPLVLQPATILRVVLLLFESTMQAR